MNAIQKLELQRFYYNRKIEELIMERAELLEKASDYQLKNHKKFLVYTARGVSILREIKKLREEQKRRGLL